MVSGYRTISVHDPASVILQPLSALSVIRQDFFDLLPETGGMVHFLSMTKFMHHDIIQNFLRHQKKQAVKVQVAFSAAASPSCPLIPYSDAPVGDANDRCIITNLLRNKLHCLRGKFLKFLLRKCLFPTLLPQPLFSAIRCRCARIQSSFSCTNALISLTGICAGARTTT